MARAKVGLAALCVLALAPGLGGCAVAIVGGMAATGGVGYEAAQERGIDGAYSDFNIKTNIGTALHGQYGDIIATVYWGRVLLTGSSPTPEAKRQAEQLARGVPGVTAIYNEIDVAPSPDGWEIAQDSWITTRVRSDLVFDADIRSGNYLVETDRQSVYLIGSARSQAELDRATQIARYVPGVKRVVSYIEIRYGVANGQRPGPSQAERPLPPPPPGPPGAPPAGSPPVGMTPSAPSNAPIQVQKL